MITDQQKHLLEMAEAKGLQVGQVRLGRGYIYFIKRGGRVLHDEALYFDEAVCFLKNHNVGDSRRGPAIDERR